VHLLGAAKPNLEPLDKISDSFKKWLLNFDSPPCLMATFMNKAEYQFAKVGYFPISSLGTRVAREEVELTNGFRTDNAFMHAGPSLDELATNVSNEEISFSKQLQTMGKMKAFINKYQGNLNPLYLDYPILWLQKHRRRK